MKIKELKEAAYARGRQVDTVWYTLYDSVEEKFVRDITRHGVIDYVEDGGRYISFLRFNNEAAALGYVEDSKRFITSEFTGTVEDSPMPKMLKRVRANYKQLKNIKVVKLKAEG